MFGIMGDVWIALAMWVGVIALALGIIWWEDRRIKARNAAAAVDWFDVITLWHAEVGAP